MKLTGYERAIAHAAIERLAEADLTDAFELLLDKIPDLVPNVVRVRVESYYDPEPLAEPAVSVDIYARLGPASNPLDYRRAVYDWRWASLPRRQSMGFGIWVLEVDDGPAPVL